MAVDATFPTDGFESFEERVLCVPSSSSAIEAKSKLRKERRTSFSISSIAVNISVCIPAAPSAACSFLPETLTIPLSSNDNPNPSSRPTVGSPSSQKRRSSLGSREVRRRGGDGRRGSGEGEDGESVKREAKTGGADFGASGTLRALLACFAAPGTDGFGFGVVETAATLDHFATATETDSLRCLDVVRLVNRLTRSTAECELLLGGLGVGGGEGDAARLKKLARDLRDDQDVGGFFCSSERRAWCAAERSTEPMLNLDNPPSTQLSLSDTFLPLPLPTLPFAACLPVLCAT